MKLLNVFKCFLQTIFMIIDDNRFSHNQAWKLRICLNDFFLFFRQILEHIPIDQFIPKTSATSGALQPESSLANPNDIVITGDLVENYLSVFERDASEHSFSAIWLKITIEIFNFLYIARSYILLILFPSISQTTLFYWNRIIADLHQVTDCVSNHKSTFNRLCI